MPQFNSIRDEKDAIDYLLEKLEGKKSISDLKVNQHNSIDESIKLLELRKENIDVFGDDTPEWVIDELENLLDHIRIAFSGIDPTEREYVDTDGTVPETWSSSDAFQWGEWRIVNARSITGSDGAPLGYSPNGELKHCMAPPGGGATWHIYTTPPPVIAWNLTRIEQKGITFLIGKAKVCEIDAVSSVPALPEAMTSTETASRVLNRQKAENEWQRRVNAKRILQIADFIDLPGNIIANSALLFSPPGADSINASNEGVVTIDFSKFLKGAPGVYMDHWVEDDSSELSADLRPMWLIDGQHRTRGLAQSEIGSQMEIPIILFTDEFSLNESAKVFAEINTLQKPLAPLHTLFMQHRFNIPQDGGKRDFKPWDENDDETFDSRQNNLSYECAGWLAANEGGPLFNRIKFLEANQPRFTIIKANSWVDYSRYWFKSQPYPPLVDMTIENIYKEVENYFTAFVNICNHSDWPEEKETDKHRWSLNSMNKGLLQMHSTSRVLLDIYGDVWEKAVSKLLADDVNESPISVKTFEKVLKPLYWVDWRDADLLAAYHGSGEVPRTALRVWMKAAIKNGESYSHKQVMSRNIKSKPGRGILSPPEDSPIVNSTPEKKWPTSDAGGELILTSVRPEHALATARWTITDPNDREYGPTGGHKVQAKTEGVSAHKLKWESWMDNVDFIKVKVQWSNVNPPNASYVTTLRKPAPESEQ